jgi:hypothetical protein
MKRVISTLVAAVALAACTSTSTPSSRPQAGRSDTGSREDGRRSFGSWTIDVSLRDPSVGPLTLATGELRAAPRNDAGPWVQHDLIFRNTGKTPLRFDDTRTSKFVSRKRLLVADEGCGYGLPTPDGPAQAGACRRNLDEFVVPPKGSVTREITLFKDLPGMADLAEGTYVFRKKIRFAAGGRKNNDKISIVYDIQRDQNSSPVGQLEIPDVIGTDLRRAVSILEDIGLEVDVSALPKIERGYATGFQTHPRVKVVEMDPPSGTQVQEGATVAILRAECSRKEPC